MLFINIGRGNKNRKIFMEMETQLSQDAGYAGGKGALEGDGGAFVLSVMFCY